MYKLSIPITDELASLAKQAAEKDSRSMASLVKLAIKKEAQRIINQEK